MTVKFYMLTLMALLYPAMLMNGVYASSQQLLKPIKSGTKQVGYIGNIDEAISRDSGSVLFSNHISRL